MSLDERRYYGLDALRGGMMMLGIVLHGAAFYLAAPPPTLAPMTDRNTSYVFDIVFAFIHSFRMPTFFVLAGVFTALLVEKRGLWGTYKNRAARVLAPLAAGVFTILPLCILFMVDLMLALRFGTHSLLPDRAQFEVLGRELRAQGVPTDQASFLHLWFLYYLCWFYLLIPLCRFLVPRGRAAEAAIRTLLSSRASIGLFALWTAATLWPFRAGQVIDGFIYVTPHPPSLAYYGSFFVLGYLLHAQRGFLATLARWVPWTAALGAAMFPLSLIASRLDDGSTLAHLEAVSANALCTWALIYCFIGSAQRFFDRESPWTLYMSQSSYWVFLVHMPLVCMAGWWLTQFDLPAEAKFAAIVAYASVIAFVTYHYLVQRTWVSAFLNGRRFDLDWPWRRNSPAPARSQPGHATPPG